MFELIRKPLPPPWLLAASLAITGCVALYCAAYAGLAGRTEPLDDALAWALVNILPWFLAFEVGKRFRPLTGSVMVAVALAASLGLQFLLSPDAALGFELVRRLPALVAVAALLVVLSMLVPGRSHPQPRCGELPLSPQQIDWISAAGNYVELHGYGRTIIHRASLASLEGVLADHGFVRVHRSALVRRARIARVRPADIVLHDGTSIRTGKRFRRSLD